MNCNDIKEKIDKKEISTPCYVIDTAVLDNHIDKMIELARDVVGFCYAMKANPFLVKHIDERIHRIEVCSPGELEICMAKKIPGKDIVFSGVNKNEKNVKDAMEYGVDVITLESIKHFNLVRDYCKSNKTSAKVIIRLSSGAQFGMAMDELRTIIENRDKNSFVDIVGIHYFTGTQKRNISKTIEEINYIDTVIKSLKEEYGFECKLLEYGTGLSVPYFIGEDFDARYDGLKALVEHVKEISPDYSVIFEMGRFFVAESMQYLTSIEDCKQVESANICIVDGGIHHLNYYGQNMAMRVPRIDVISDMEGIHSVINADESDKEWTVCGSLCTFADMLVRKAKLGEVSCGDVLVFNDAGAYSITEAPILFLSRKMPDIYLCGEQNTMVAIRHNKESFTINM